MLGGRTIPVKLKGDIYRTVIKWASSYGADIWATMKRQRKLDVNEIYAREVRMICRATRTDTIVRVGKVASPPKVRR